MAYVDAATDLQAANTAITAANALIDEKKALLDRIVAEKGWAFFTHDPMVATARIERDAKGRYVAKAPRPTLS